MTLKELAIFKHFIAEKDLRKPFGKVYRASHNFAKLPTKIEEYFSNVEPLAVILSAARVCQPNGVFGYDFWQELHQAWKIYYDKLISSNFINEDNGRLERLEGYYSILRENWDNADKPWRFEDKNTAAERLGLNPIEAPKPVEEAPLIDFGEEEEEGDDLDIDFVHIDKTTRISNGLRAGIISVNTRSHSFKVGVNRIDTKDIKKKDFKYAMVGKTKSGDVVIQFNNNEKGISIFYSPDRYININSRQFVENLRRLLSIEDDLVYLRIELISDKVDSITYKVTRQ